MTTTILPWGANAADAAAHQIAIRNGSIPEKAEAYFLARHTSRKDLSWLEHFAEVVTAAGYQDDVAWFRNVLGAIAWADRAATGPLAWDDAFLRYSSDTLIGKCHIYYVALWLRYDFRFVDLDRTTRAWLSNSSNVEPDALVLAHRAFALLEQNTRDATKYLDAALESPNASSKSRDACLHALWLSRGLPDQAERMLAVVKDMTIKGDVISSVVLFRQAFAFRLLQQWDDALDAIDEAFNHL